VIIGGIHLAQLGNSGDSRNLELSGFKDFWWWCDILFESIIWDFFVHNLNLLNCNISEIGSIFESEWFL
jgi:hypothetical protein